MEKISKVKFVDASYFMDFDDPTPKELSVHEAYGYTEDYEDKVIINYIEPVSGHKFEMIKGLIIPKDALFSNKNQTKPIKDKIKTGYRVSIYWKDVVYVANMKTHSYSTMYTEGLLEKISDKFLIIRDPETIRIDPLPIKNHPEIKPARYMIPISIIKKIELIK